SFESSDPYFRNNTSTTFKFPSIIPVCNLFIGPVVIRYLRDIKLEISGFIVFVVHENRFQLIIEAQTSGQVDDTSVDGDRIHYDRFVIDGDGYIYRVTKSIVPVSKVRAFDIGQIVIGFTIRGIPPHPIYVIVIIL